jgi:hypothetical protein
MIEDTKTLKFAKMSLAWWDKHHFWHHQKCAVLSDGAQNHLCYIFYKMDQYREYINIHNIFTPQIEKRKGYGYELLKLVFDLANNENIKRFKMSCISSSLDFYLALGFVYWGLTSARYYYCDLPMPNGLDDLDAMVQRSSTKELIGKKIDTIHSKTHEHELHLSQTQEDRYTNDKLKMKEQYIFEDLKRFNA